MIGKAIVSYLENNRRLVVPNFGAFIKKDDTGEVVFMEFLKKDDHELTTYLESVYSVSTPEATQAIERFVGEAKRQIMYKGGYLIEGLGVLKSGSSNMYRLDYNPFAAAGGQVEQVAMVDRVAAPIVVAEQPKAEPRLTKHAEASAVAQAEPAVGEVRGDGQRHLGDESVRGLRYGKPNKVEKKPGKRRADSIMIIALLAALLAIATLIYGVVMNAEEARNLLNNDAITQVVGADTDGR